MAIDEPGVSSRTRADPATSRPRPSGPEAPPHIYFDVSDLVYFVANNQNLTGIQRVQASIVIALGTAKHKARAHFLSYFAHEETFLEIEPAYFLALLADLSRPASDRAVEFDRFDARDGKLPGAVPLTTEGIGEACLCLLGAAWANPDYFLRVRNLKRRHGFKFLALIHDLIPIFARDTCDQPTVERFIEWLNQSYWHTDQYLCVSEHTKFDLVRYFASIDRSITEPIVTRNGGLLPPAHDKLDVALIDRDLRPGNYALFVSTVEARKNHLGAFRAMQHLKAHRADVPYLVCVGQLGWRAEPFLIACEASDYLEGSIKILSAVSDAELAALYRNCLFSIYPSLYEGWGLPVGESLSFGKLCITSDTTSMPEVGGRFALYVDPTKPRQLADEMDRLIAAPGELGRRESDIRSAYGPIAWTEVADKVVDACRAALSRPDDAALCPALQTGREYPMTVAPSLPAGLIGPQMLQAIRARRGRLLTAGVYADDDYETGHRVRVGTGWLPPGFDATWLRAEDAGLSFRLAAPAGSLVLEAEYLAHPDYIGAELAVSSPGMAGARLLLPGGSGTVTVPLQYSLEHGGAGQVRLEFHVQRAPGAGGPAENPSSAGHAIGIRSFVVRPAEEASVGGSAARQTRLAAQDRQADAFGREAAGDMSARPEAAMLHRLVLGADGGQSWAPLRRLRQRLLLRQARRAARAKSWREAERSYWRVLQLDPGEPRFWVQYGHMIKEQGEMEAALGAYRMATRLDPNHLEGFLQLGQGLRTLGRLTEAEAALREAERLRSFPAPQAERQS